MMVGCSLAKLYVYVCVTFICTSLCAAVHLPSKRCMSAHTHRYGVMTRVPVSMHLSRIDTLNLPRILITFTQT
jgi:hypothetical protein